MRKVIALTAIVCFAFVLGCKEKSPEEKGKEALKAAAEKVPDSPEKVVTEAAKAVKEGNLIVAYAMLPDSYQADVQAVVKLVADNMDKDIYEKGFALLPKAVEALKKNEQMKPFAPVAEKAVKILTDAKLNTIDGLKAFDVAGFLADHGKAITDLGFEISKMMGQEDAQKEFDVKAELKGEIKEDKATVVITRGEKTEEVEFVKVEGKWITAKMAKEWKEGLAEAKKEIPEGMKKVTENKEQIVQQIDAFGKMIDEGQMDQLQQMVGGML